MRISWIDNAKAIGIFLIVLAHGKGIETSVKTFIYSFHVPLFFLLAGVLLKDKHLNESFRSYTVKNVKILVIPYFCFWIISYLYSILSLAVRNGGTIEMNVRLLEPIIGLFFGVGNTLGVNQVLWFFTCLYCTTTIFYFVSKLKNKNLIALLLIIFGLLGPIIHQYITIRLPWNLELSFVAIVFYGFGYLLSKSNHFQELFSIKSRFLIILSLLGTLLFAVKFNGQVNMNKMQFGNLALFYLGAFSGIGITILLSQIIPKNIFSEWLSRNTIIIFPLHPIIFSVFTAIGVIILGLDYNFKENFILNIIYTMGTFAVCFPLAYIINRYFPWMAGYRQTSPNKL